MILPSTALHGKQLVLGVTGSISCYKAVEVASTLAQLGVQVNTVLTESATRFVSPLTFQAVTGHPAYAAAALWGQEAHILHTRLAREADLLAVVPATAQFLAAHAAGQADSLLLVTALACECPMLIAPAMDGGMWRHPATQANAALLQARGVICLGPAAGHLASGQTGVGRLVEPDRIVSRIRTLLGQKGSLQGCRMVVTAGGTREPLDPVRFLGNRSSGKQGLALARAAQDRGATVTLITTAPCPADAATQVRRVETARDMQEAVTQACAQADVLVMAAAVADYRPARPARQKLKKDQGPPSLTLVSNPDILASLGTLYAETGRPRIKVGFAAETESLRQNAWRKMAPKGLDLIVANDVSGHDTGFGSEYNAALILDRAGGVDEVSRTTKFHLAERILDRIETLLAERRD